MKPVQYYAKFRDAAREDNPVVITRQISIVFDEIQIFHKNILTFQTYVEDKQGNLLKHLVRADGGDLLKQATFEPGSVLPVLYTKRRVGSMYIKYGYENLNIYIGKTNELTILNFLGA